MEEPLISIVVTTYNHEDYIERCLRGIAMQQCSYPFEVLIGEDCSPDGTREVLKRLEAELPSNFHFFYREHNMGAMGDNNSNDLVNRARGKYLACCEGDDFWTYEGKLQKQVEFLESHPEYVACFHHCTVVGADSEPNGEKYPDCPEEDYSFREFFYITMPGQLATFLCRREPYLEAKRRYSELQRYNNYASDRRNAFILLVEGKVRCFQESWSAYRHITSGGTSHSATFHYSRDFATNEVLYGQTLVDYAERYGNEEALRAAKETAYRVRFRWCHGKYKVESLKDIMHDLAGEKHRLSLATTWFRWYAVLALRMARGRSVTL